MPIHIEKSPPYSDLIASAYREAIDIARPPEQAADENAGDALALPDDRAHKKSSAEHSISFSFGYAPNVAATSLCLPLRHVCIVLTFRNRSFLDTILNRKVATLPLIKG